MMGKNRRTCFHGDLDRIGTLRGLKRRWGKPVKHAANPLPFPGTPDQPVQDQNAYYDEAADQWKMWYTTVAETPVGTCVNPLAYAVSSDGIEWERPNLGIIERESPSERNLVYASEGKSVSGAGVLFEPDEPDPGRRHKLFYCTQVWTPETGVKHDSDCRVAFSPDGLHWTPYEGNPVLHVISDTRHGVFKDLATGRYVCPVRLRIDGSGNLLYKHGDPITPDSVRCCGRIESEDFIHWSEPELIIAPSDWTCPGDSYYGIMMFPYEGAYLGLLQVFHRYAPNHGYLEEQLVLSEDMRHWRPIGDSFFIPAGEPGEWDSGCISAASRIVAREDDILFYYGGTPRSHGGGGPPGAPTQWLGLATLRRDGFAYLQPPWHEGLLITHPFACSGGRLHINADSEGGEVSAALLDEHDKPIAGYTHEDCSAIRGNDTEATLRWRKRSALPRGKAVRIEFRLRDADLYSYWARSSAQRVNMLSF